MVEADGGSACWGGGGGAVSIEFATGSSTQLQLRARPGTSCATYRAGAGSVFVLDASSRFGTLTLDKLVQDSAAEQKKLLFLPGRLTAGIEPSDDPLIRARDAAYAVSFSRRNSAPQR